MKLKSYRGASWAGLQGSKLGRATGGLAGQDYKGARNYPGYYGRSRGQESQLLPGNQRDISSFA